MKWLKKIDLWLQVIVPLITLIICALNQEDPDRFFFIYVNLGVLQLISWAAHLFGPTQLFFYKERVRYGWTVAISIAIGCILIAYQTKALILYLFLMLFVSPGYACWYFSICYREIKMLKERDLIHLK